MKILIVDDNANNRMVLRLLIEEFTEPNTLTVEMQEAENGLIAVQKATETKYDVIFMDIMMPEMDGIEATKKIRAIDKNVMIIAVSAVDDELRQKEILREGAEDYIPKPIDSEVLNARLENYLALLKLRHHGNLSAHRKAANLYTKNIFNRQTIFYVTSEEALAEFWEYYLLRETPSKLDNLSDTVRAIFTLGENIIKQNGEPWIIVEADDTAIYFTINQLDIVGDLVFKLIMKKNPAVVDYKKETDKVSFKLLQLSQEEETVSEVVEEKVEEPEVVVEHALVEITSTDTSSYEVFKYMDADDMAEVEETLGDLNSLMLVLARSDVEESEISDIAAYLDKLGRTISVYTESYKIGRALSTLSRGIADNATRFQELASDLSTMSAAFSSDLQQWYQMTFFDGAPSLDFMDATIQANVETICAMLSADENAVDEGDMDDIFDF
jgi:CheY-like chemotaxis protein